MIQRFINLFVRQTFFSPNLQVKDEESFPNLQDLIKRRGG